jgi:CheY-like chemotaxis protein
MESQLRQSQKMEAVGQLTAGVAHNFNNMLQGIMSNIEMVDETDSSRPFLVEATTASERAADMVRQLMLFARQGVQFEPRACDVGDLIERVVEICRSTFDRGFRISVDLQEDLRQTWGDPAQLEQVLLNLLLNARDAIAEVPASRMEKRIDIRAYSLHTEQPTADTRAGAYIRVEVADSGVGMDPETRRRIFNPFFTTKEIGDGSGLGLATAFGIVRHHGGWIDCDSALGVGSTFTIHLPVVSGDQQQEPTESSESDPPFPAGTETILIADDEYAVRNPVAMILRASGYSVLEARDGRETLFLLKSESHKIDLVLLDLSMPEISGHEVLKRLRTQHPGVKTVIFTGEPSESDVPDDETVLRKPIRLNELAQALRDVLDR